MRYSLKKIHSTVVPIALVTGALGGLFVAMSPHAAAERAKRVRVRGRCNSCHKASFDQWKGSPHQTAWTNPVFVRLMREGAAEMNGSGPLVQLMIELDTVQRP